MNTTFLILWIGVPVLALTTFWFLLRTHPAFGKFIWQMFCDTQGKPGLGRVAAWVALHFVILWDTHIVWKTEKVPDMTTLIGEVLFVGGLYSIEKLPEIVAAWKGNPIQTKMTEPPVRNPAPVPAPVSDAAPAGRAD